MNWNNKIYYADPNKDIEAIKNNFTISLNKPVYLIMGKRLHDYILGFWENVK